MHSPVTTNNPPRTRRVNATLVRLEGHLAGLQRHLDAIGLRAEAAALATDLRYVAELRRSTR